MMKNTDVELYSLKIVIIKYFIILKILVVYIWGHAQTRIKEQKKILIASNSSYVNKNTKKFGFPLTTYDIGKIDDGEDLLLKRYTFRHLIDMDKPLPSGMKKTEYIVDFSKDPRGELIIIL